ncbi:MAG: glycine cleavage system aminomethyltransferase GcvT [Alphaproteobacteria bacterium]|nr:glycine cleavage system aminomethyltransferase GcvT [Alphaproteobacteria bacterium]MBU1526183.1 glycine cleavage system aminomethyltransferase GcvT [Alphaproteobacteria bacterium]MBU2117398.1 glycine cleavage system aminomethyltransferase GcvT [Alphaproteobacteria bacterium]MBU2350535.1 glycine cleavage system aminomethyltransferase GcvT [Alphaproteobacteria bacterium]MBU2381000.1 glycine cleavage system aminomethyltransferase GcvT [Alphaproteobacteria bacterium]
MTDATLKTTPLNANHRRRGARMVGFGGYDMPVQYEGVLAEHRWTREHAGLFDVSHMGQARITGADAIAQFERFVPGDYQALKAGKQKYSLLLNDRGGILDDLMAGKPDHDGLYVVVNAGNKDADFAHLRANLSGDATLKVLDDRALLAIQGPEAAEVMAQHEPVLAEMGFMDSARLMLFGVDCYVSRSGYTGEDGYEISVPAADADRIWDLLLEDARVKPIGLGARDSLRLEAGLPLHGHDIDAETTPVEAGLTFALSKSRKERADFAGAETISRQLAGGVARVRVALIVKEGAPAREGAEIADADGNLIGKITSGGPSPTLGKNVAMGYVPPQFAALGTELKVVVRGKPAAAEIVALPFVAQRYYRKPKA